MNTVENLTTDEVRGEFFDTLMKLGSFERQDQVRKLLEEVANCTQFTTEEEVYLRALRGMRKR